MIYQFHICEVLSDKAVKGLMNAAEPIFKGLRGDALGLLVYDVDEIYDVIVDGKIEGFTSQEILSVKYLIDSQHVKFIGIDNPDIE